MKVNYNVAISALTSRKLCKNEEWDDLMKARFILFQKYIEAFEKEKHKTYDEDVKDLPAVVSYTLEKHPELEVPYHAIMGVPEGQPSSDMAEKCRPLVPDEYEFEPVPIQQKNPEN